MFLRKGMEKASKKSSRGIGKKSKKNRIKRRNKFQVGSISAGDNDREN